MVDLTPFESADILIDGGKGRISEFEAGCNAFIKASTHTVIRQRDPKSGDEFFKFRFEQRVPPRLRHIASGIVNDFRSALDHAFCDAALLLGRANAKGIYFPFSQSALEINRQIKRVCREVEPALCVVVKGMQPYPGGDELLYKLATLSNRNKHQAVISISLAENGIEFNLTRIGAYGLGEIEIGIMGWNELRNEITFARIGKNRIIPDDVQNYIKPTIKIVIEKGEAPVSGPAPAVLSAFASKVESIVLALKCETARILEARQP